MIYFRGCQLIKMMPAFIMCRSSSYKTSLVFLLKSMHMMLKSPLLHNENANEHSFPITSAPSVVK